MGEPVVASVLFSYDSVECKYWLMVLPALYPAPGCTKRLPRHSETDRCTAA